MAIVINSPANSPSRQLLAKSAIPVLLAPNGIVAANGTLTLGTNLSMGYLAGAWVRLPAGAVKGGAAGLYWTVFVNGNVGNVKNCYVDPAQPFVPYAPAGPLVPAEGSGVAYTQTTGADITLANVTVPGGAMGPNGALKLFGMMSQTNTAGTKIHALRMGGVLVHGRNRTTIMAEGYEGRVRNRGLPTTQITALNQYPTEPASAGSGAYAMLSINTAIDQPLTFTGQLSDPKDFIVLEAMHVEVEPA